MIILFLCLVSFGARAHPVTFQGGWAFTSWNTPMMGDQSLGYSLTSRHAAVARHLVWRGEGEIPREFFLSQANWLAKRWNGDGVQANLYLGAAVGLERRERGKTGAGAGVFEADWETRKHYLAGKYQLMGEGLEYARLRAGLTPYQGEYADLHTWVMVQLEHQPEHMGPIQITPLLRFFHGNVLWEAGASLQGQWLFTFMIHI